MLTLTSGTSPRPGTTPAGQTKSPVQSTVNDVPGPMKANSAGDTDKGLNQLDDEHQSESEIHEAQNDEDRVCDPLARTSTDGNLTDGNV